MSRDIPIDSQWVDQDMPTWSPWRTVRVVMVDLLGRVTVAPVYDEHKRFHGQTKPVSRGLFGRQLVPHEARP